MDRICEVRALLSYDSEREERFSRLARIACKMFDMPVAMVAWMGAATQMVKGVNGFDISEAPRSVSFCNHTIYHQAPVIVEDTWKDERFNKNPWVIAGPMVRFYAGYPVRGPRQGFSVGTICLYDTKPRAFSNTDITLLRDLALQVEESLIVDWSLEVGDQLRHRAMELTEHFESTDDLVFWALENGDIVYSNAALLQTLGYRGGRKPQELHKLLEVVDESQGRHFLLHRSGRKIPVKGGGTHGTLDGAAVIRWTVRDLSEEARRETTLMDLAETDELTQLFNRRGFMKRLEELLSLDIPITVAMIDMDNFKAINDTLGHEAGDHALVRMARCLRQTMRGADVVGRLGGDEFCVALPRTSLHEAWGAFDRLHANYSINAPIAQGIKSTLSVGIVQVQGGNVTDVMALADQRLYDAKKSGRNQTSWAPPPFEG